MNFLKLVDILFIILSLGMLFGILICVIIFLINSLQITFELIKEKLNCKSIKNKKLINNIKELPNNYNSNFDKKYKLLTKSQKEIIKNFYNLDFDIKSSYFSKKLSDFQELHDSFINFKEKYTLMESALWLKKNEFINIKKININKKFIIENIEISLTEYGKKFQIYLINKEKK